MHRPSWLRSKPKLKSGSFTDSSKASSSAQTKSQLSNYELGDQSQPAQPKVVPYRSLWDRAYDDLRDEKKDLVEAFENMLIPGHETKAPWHPSDNDPLGREKRMSALVDEKLATMNDNRWRIEACGRSVEIREQVDRVVKVILVAKDFITPFANLDPVHAGLPWAGVCMLLPLMVKDNTQRAAAINGLEYISQLVCRYEQIEHIYFQGEGFALRNDFETAITKLYAQILEYEARAVCQFNRKTGNQTMRNIVGADNWDGILDSIKKSEEECDKFRAIIDKSDQQSRTNQLEIMLSQQFAKVNELCKTSRAQDEALLAEIKAMREDQKVSFQNQIQADCHKCFRVAIYENTMDKNPNRVSGTCEWFLRHSKYIDWLNDQTQNLLWVTADPGCGKSVLSRFLVHDYRSWMWKDTSICYFFFKDDSEENRSATHALCSILHQLFSQNPALLKHAMPEFKSNGDKLSLIFRSLWNILLSAAADPDSGGIVCILDALDECSELSCQQIAEHLADFQSTADGKAKIKFLVTSRPNDFIWRIFSQRFSRNERDLASIQLMGENDEEMKEISAEINLLVDAKVQDFKKLRSLYGIDDNADVAVKAKLDEIENRTYLWIALIFPELDMAARHAEDELLATIKRIPSTVDEAYEKILSKSSNAHQARKLLHIVCAASRPLTLAEMNRALSIRDKDHMNALKPPESFRSYVRELCGLFISIQNSRIYLIHQTAKEFLIGRSTSEELFSPAVSHEGAWKNSLESADSHHLLAQICMSFFFSPNFGSNPLAREVLEIPFFSRASRLREYAKKNDFLLYSALEWASHFQRARSNKKKQMTSLSTLALEICNPQSPPCQTWFPHYLQNSQFHVGVNLRRMTSLHVASFLGLEELVRLLLARDDVKCDPKDEHGRTSLVWATVRGHLQAMKLLLARDGVDPNSTDDEGQTPLRWAIRYNHIQAAELLLTQTNVDPDSKDINNRTPLSYAADYGRIETVQLLLARKGVDPDSKDINNRTPLSYAAEDGRIDTIQLLLAQGVDPDSKDINNRTPLSYAAEDGRIDIIQLLLAQGVDPDSKDINNRTPLSYAAAAAKYENDTVVELLLAQGVDPDYKDNDGHTPKWWAESSRDYKIIKMLRARKTAIASSGEKQAGSVDA